MPIKDPDVNRIYQRNWKRKIVRAKHKIKLCADCGTKKNLTYGPEFVLCLKCKSTRSTLHLVKPPNVRRLITIKKYTRHHIRRSFGLAPGTKIDEDLAYLWAGKLDEAVRLGLVKPGIAAKTRKEVLEASAEYINGKEYFEAKEIDALYKGKK